MALFQHSVLDKYLKDQDQQKIDSAYNKFKEYFQNPKIQQNIKDTKEEQFQEGFLRELFVKILGYTINPNPDFNLTTEFKNEKGAKKADGAILLDGKALAVIELKGTDTKDLDKINIQAFNYKNNQSACIYVITSNFEKLRFFIHNAVENIEFNLFTLTPEKFQLLWLCLNVENIFKGIPLKVKEESLLEEEKVTKNLYKDYAAFRMELWQNMVANNPQLDELLLFKKTQKLLDRYLFIFFAEDSGLLPPNSISRIVKRWNILQEEDAYKPLYDIFKQYFGYINTGRKGQKAIDNIFAYNGGLFQPDEMLDKIVLEDNVLHKHVMKITKYDFQSEVDVNILGHIFENSLNEIENITAKLEGQEIDKSKTKRKKDGVFYTPKYITKYIVENTVGKLCKEKKSELGIIDEEYAKGRKKRKKETIKKLDENLQAYRNWLLNITICDPACGSGAFLNQALEFLITEHAYIDELSAQLFGASIVFQDVSNHILEKNIYGVDINEESVEIAKLSLWLRTAQRGRKLTILNKNIKCGNSLIDDPEVAGEKAFNWQKEFPAIFQEKYKKAFHITTATHDSRTSQRMIDYKVREKRDNGLRPNLQPIWLELADELLITKKVAEIVKEDKLNVMAYNICGDHMHLLLVCEDEEVPKIVGKIKAKTALAYNSEKGITTRGHVPLSKEKNKKYNSLWTQKFGCNEIEDEKQLRNTIEYIENNRNKHELPALNNETQAIIKDMLCTFDYAFRTEYNGGFDVVIGNPPYVRVEFIPEIYVQYFKENFITATSKFDLSSIFFEKSVSLLNTQGIYSIITSYQFIYAGSGIGLRSFIAKNTNCSVIMFSSDSQVFEGATTYAGIFIAKRDKADYVQILQANNEFQQVNITKQFLININNFTSERVIIADTSILDKMEKHAKKVLGKEIGVAKTGVVTSADDVFFMKENNVKKLNLESELIYPIIGPNELEKWYLRIPETLCLYPYSENNGKTTLIELDTLKNKFLGIYSYLLSKKDKLSARSQGRKDYSSSSKWYQLNRPREKWIYDSQKIIYPGTTNIPKFAFDEKGQLFRNARVYAYLLNEKYVEYYQVILAILNSNLTKYLITLKCPPKANNYFEMSTGFMDSYPFVLPVGEKKEIFILISESMIKLNAQFYELNENLIKLIQSKFSIEKITLKLQKWHELEFKDFLKELKKAKVQLTLSEEAEWMQYFTEQKQKAQELKAEINRVDAEINQMVYELYGLTEEEIKIVETA